MSSERIFVGRGDELKAFDQVLRAPQGQAVLVIGPQGMGKTLLVNKMASSATNHPDLVCDHVRFEVAETDTPDTVMELMIDRAFDAAGRKEGLLDGSERRTKQYLAVLKLVTKVDAIGDLILSLGRYPKKNARDQLLEKLELISKRMADNARAIFVIDSEKYMRKGSADAWQVVVRNLPDKIKFLFAQRPEDALAASDEFKALTVTIPKGPLSILDERAVEDLIQARASELGQPIDDVRSAIERYQGHPYAVGAALDLLADGRAITDLRSDPTPERVAEAQWRRVCDEHGESAIKLLEAYAILQVAVPDEVVEPVSGLSGAARKKLLASRFLAGLLRDEPDGRRFYHSLLADHIRGQVSHRVSTDYHTRAIDVYRKRLNAEVRPNALAAARLPEHVLAAEGQHAFVEAFTDECLSALLTLGLLDAAEGLGRRSFELVDEGTVQEAVVTGNLGVIHMRNGDLDRAEEMHRRSLQIEQKLGHLEGIAGEYGNLGLICQTRGDLDRAEEMHRKALEIEEKLGRREGMARQYGNLALIYQTRGDLDRAEELHRKALEINEKLGCLDGMATNYGNLGVVYQTCGDLDRAEEMYRKSLAIDEKLGRREGMARQYGNLGVIYKTRGDLDRAEEMLRRALAIDEKLGRLEGMANQYANLGVIYETRGDLDRAEEMHRKALAIDEKLGRREGMASQYGNLGVIYRTRGDLDRAEEMHRKALAIDEKLGRPEGMANQYANLGLIYKARGDLDQAEEMLRKALAINEKLGRLEGMGDQYGNLGLIYKSRGDLNRAEEMLRKSLEINENLGRLEGVGADYANLGAVYEMRGDVAKARGLGRQARELYERIGMPHMVEKVQDWLDRLPPEAP